MIRPQIIAAVAIPDFLHSDAHGYDRVIYVYLAFCALAAVSLLLVRPHRD